jgi:dihydroxy-acid dehydratase
MDARRKVMAHMSGRRIVELVREDIRLSRFLTRPAFENAVRVLSALGGSTNAVVHLIALAGRAGVPFTLDDWDRLARGVPCLVDLMPSGAHLMDDFFHAGGVPAVMREIADLLQLDAPTVGGPTLGEIVTAAECHDRSVIHPRETPFKPEGGLAILRGNLEPDGAVLKVSAASPHLLRHQGRAVVFEDIHDYRRRIEDPDLEVTADDILVLRGCGPRGYPGFPEVGNLALPPKLLRQGVRDMVRISDARMSGTAFGTVVLHVAPEAAAGGPLSLVRTGDLIEIDVPGRRLELRVGEAELARRAADTPAPVLAERGYARLYQSHVLQADRGADFDFLVGSSGAAVPLDSH